MNISLFVDDELVNKRKEENRIIEDISKGIFFNYLNKNKIDLYDFINENNKVTTKTKDQFNFLLQKIKKDINMDISDILLYLDEDFIEINKLIPYLDSETKQIISEEYKRIHGIKSKKSKLNKFFSL